jgi:lactate racemase
MITYAVPFGRDKQTLTLSETQKVDLIDPADVLVSEDPFEIVRASIHRPLGSKKLEDFSSAKSVAIAINDKTRPVPHSYLLPPLLKKLAEVGIERKNIRFIAATGTHAIMPPYEFARILPEEILSQYPVISHDCDNLANLSHLGYTSSGTEIWANRVFYESDLKILVGNIEPHHFAGFSGGFKTAAIGLAGRETINQNHSMLLDPNARIGEYDQNPLRQDIEEIGQKMGVDFALNVILNAKKAIVSAYFGDPLSVIKAGIPVSRQVSQTEVQGLYDLVIASAGGYPKDINFYQAQKALTYASLMAKEGGTIILIAACPEGSGSEAYENFMDGLDSYEAVFEKFKKVGFHVGPHKAIQVAQIASHKRVIVVSQIPPELIYHLLLTPAPDLQSAFELVQKKLPPVPTIAILPHATNTIPVLEQRLNKNG